MPTANLNHQNSSNISLDGGARSTTPNESASALPGEDDRCLECGYPLRHLQKWCCPECGSVSSATDHADHQTYVANAKEYALERIFLPVGGFIGVSAFLILIYNTTHQLGAKANGVVTFGLVGIAVVYIPLQLWMLIRGAARLTQIQVIHRHAPMALTAKPAPAILVFTMHLAWMSVIPILTFGTITGCLLQYLNPY